MTQPVRIPADIEREDTLIAHLTARQVLILATVGIVLYGAWSATRTLLPLAAFAVLALPVAATTAVIALTRRDGLPMDRLLLAALRQHLAPRIRINAPEGIPPAPPWLARLATPADRQPLQPAAGPLRLPARAVTDTGVIHLGSDGLAAIAACTTVNFALRTPTEQDALVAVFARYLHSLTAPIQILIRAERLDLSGQTNDLREQAGRLPHPALEEAALAHADYLAELAHTSNPLRRQVLLVLREPLRAAGPGDAPGRPGLLASRRRDADRSPDDQAAVRAAATRLARRLTEASDLLHPAGIQLTTLNAEQASAVLTAACNPDTLPPSTALAAPDQIITGALPGADPLPELPKDDEDPRTSQQPHCGRWGQQYREEQ